MPAIPYSGTRYVCDRCGNEAVDNQYQFGRCYASLSVEHGQMVNGTPGGATTRSWLCGHCAIALRHFMKRESGTKEDVLKGWLRAARLCNDECGSFSEDPSQLTARLLNDSPVEDWVFDELLARITTAFESSNFPDFA